MLTNAFIGQAAAPTDAQLSVELGRSRRHWDSLIAALPECSGREWNSYSPKAGWAMRLKQRKRNIVYLAPSRRAFTAMLILGDRAVAAAREAGLVTGDEKKYPEGTAFRVEVRTAKDVEQVRKLAAIKMQY
jgi:hypothetical protein